MANPQIEKGHTRIANEILEHISKTNLNGTQFRIVMVIWRYTYGFQRKQHELSNAYISHSIGIKNRSVVVRELNILLKRKIIISVGIGLRGTKILSFNKNYDEWDHTQVKEETQQPKQVEPKKPKKQVRKYDESNTYFKMAMYFHGLVSTVAKEAGVEHLIKKANLNSWADDFRKLIELDGVDKRLAKDVMDWVTQHDFWKINVLSAKKLREKFSELAIKMNAANKPKQINKPKDIKDKEIEFQRFLEKGGVEDEFDWGS
jgi:phage replication O-like protein O